MRVLLVEDDPDLLDVASYALRKYGHDVSTATDGVTAVERWQAEQPDLVLLDLNLPRLSGLDVCRAIRQQADTPIIMVTAHGDEQHLVEGFEAGADDYVTKPLNYRALAMRMQAVRRRRGRAGLEPRTTGRVGDLEVDLEAHECRKGGVPIRLTEMELRVLYHLVSNAGRVLPTPRLIELVWGYESGDAFALKSHISQIRHKLGMGKGQPGSITAVPRVGYRFEVA